MAPSPKCTIKSASPVRVARGRRQEIAGVAVAQAYAPLKPAHVVLDGYITSSCQGQESKFNSRAGLMGLSVVFVPRYIKGQEAIASYWVMESTHGKYVLIHRGKCHLCREGKGPRPGQVTGLWHGPFPSFTEARDMALSTGRAVGSPWGAMGPRSGNCRLCKPE